VTGSVVRQSDGRWARGASGNVSGRPPGTRNRFSEKFVSDVAAIWDQHGADVLQKMVADEPSRFVELCGRLIPRDVSVTLQTRLPGNLETDDWSALLELLSAIKTALPNDMRRPGEIAHFVSEAIRAHASTLIDALPAKEQTANQGP